MLPPHQRITEGSTILQAETELSRSRLLALLATDPKPIALIGVCIRPGPETIDAFRGAGSRWWGTTTIRRRASASRPSPRGPTYAGSSAAIRCAAATGSPLSRSGRPTTMTSAPSATAADGVATRA